MTSPPAIACQFEPLASQQGMLLHVLADAATPCFQEQVWCTLDGPLNAAALEAACAAVVARHETLRSSFHLRDATAIRQCVHEHVPLAWTREDWSGATDVDERTAAFARRVDAWPIATDAPPLLRFGLVTFGPGRHLFAWKFHHLILDGWSAALVIREIFQAYAAARAGQPLNGTPASPGFRDYVSWVHAQDSAIASGCWRDLLRGFEAPAPLASRSCARAGAEQHASADAVLDESTLERLQQLARREHLTFGTLLQGAWALVIVQWLERSDVVFGLTSSGRHVDLPSVEQIVGPLATTIPMRAVVDRSQDLPAWLHALQRSFNGVARYQWDPVRHDGRPVAAPLFETVIVFENYPVLAVGEPVARDLRLSAVRFDGARTGYPLVLLAMSGGRAFDLRLVYDRRSVDPLAASQLVAAVTAALTAMAVSPVQTVGDILTTVAQHLDPLRRVDRVLERPAPSPPVLPIEQEIADIWTSLLGIDAIGRDDNFFDLGGHSLAATRMIERVNDQFSVRIPLVAAFGIGATVAGLAEAVESAIIANASDDELAAALEALSDEGNLPDAVG